MLLAIFAVWFTTSWSATLVRADQSRTRWLVLAVMLLGLFMNASVTRAFTTSGWAFVVPLLLIQLGRTVWTLVNSTDAVLREHYFRTLLWVIATTPLWIAGAAVSSEARILWWASAAGIDQFGRWLAHPMLLIQLGRTVWTLANSADAVLREHYFRTLLWVIATTPLWIAGAAASSEARILWWALAAGIDQIGRWLAHPIPGRRLHSENVEFDADHMLERCRLFLLIALGETVLTTGLAIAEAPTAVVTLAAGTAAWAGTVALWALSFGRPHRLIIRHLEKTSDPIRASRHAVNALAIMAAGLIAVAVANEEVIARPQGQTSFALSLLLVGGPILFLAAQGWYLWAVPKVRSHLHVVGTVALLLVGLATLAAPPYVALLLVGASVSVLAIIAR